MRWLAGAFTAACHATKATVGRILLCLSLAAIFFAALYLPPSALTDQPSYDTVGAIEGEAITVQGPLNIEVVQGRTRTILRSGSDIHVNSGRARIDLIEGGQIVVCGPAHLSVLKSVNLLTLALDTGVIHAHIEGPQPALTIYTAQIQAKPFAIGDAPQDTLVGFDQTGAMCIRADSGAVRVEQQLTAQSIVVPQAGEVLITNGQLETLRSGATHCSAAAKEGPVYQVFMPPLSYDASAKVQSDNFDPRLIVLVRRVRVRPTLIFQGSVKDAPAVAKSASLVVPAKTPETPAPQSQQAQPSIFARIRAFFRSLFS